MPPKVLFLGRNDWANVSHRVARGMNAAAGAPIARVLVLEAHPFGYREDMLIGRPSADGWRQWGRAADWLISTGDGEYAAFSSLCDLIQAHGQRRATCHVGSQYRAAAARYNEADSQLGFDRRFIGGDLYRFALEDRRAVPYFAPPDQVAAELAPVRERVRIGHSPTNREKKGTSAILEVLEDLATGALGPQVEIDVIEGVTYREALARRDRCHVFIDQLHPEIGGFGASSVEALAAGCAVLADVHNVHANVDHFYPRPPIIDVRHPGELARDLSLLVRDRAELERRRRASLAWAQNWATPEAVGTYWLSHLAEPPRARAA
jgi:hypothetical protein